MGIAEIDKILPLFPQAPENPVVYAQNIKDDRYLSASCVPYIQKYAETGLIHVNLGDWGEGHKPMPRPQYLQSCKVLLKDNPFPKAEIDLDILRLRSFEHFQSELAAVIADSRESKN